MSLVAWKGACGACGEPSAKRRVWVSNDRWVEVCSKCESRWRRNSTFIIRPKRKWARLEKELRVMREAGVGLTRLSRLYTIPRGTLQWMLNNKAARSSNPTKVKVRRD
jgi:hypothetical protein